MAETKTDELEQKAIHEILPLEIFVKVLKQLGYKSIRTAKGTCKKWVQIIEAFRIVEAASSKFYLGTSNTVFFLIIVCFSEIIFNNHCWRQKQEGFDKC